jgi:hypothetical protein
MLRYWDIFWIGLVTMMLGWLLAVLGRFAPIAD